MKYTRSELDIVQERWKLRFTEDLVALLLEEGPLLRGERASFDWRTTDPETIRNMLDWPFESFWFDVENNGDWWAEWGQQPPERGAARERLKEIFNAAPKLIPLFGHRYLPEEPLESGNPVFSVYQMDVICYGANLQDWIKRERYGLGVEPLDDDIKEIRFWSDAVRKNNTGPISRNN
jgi:hypothetical protein